MSQDPMGFAALDADLYRYSGNLPSNFNDFSGLDDTPMVPPKKQPKTWKAGDDPNETVRGLEQEKASNARQADQDGADSNRSGWRLGGIKKYRTKRR